MSGGGGYDSNKVTRPKYRSGQDRQHVQKEAVLRLGQSQGDHATQTGKTNNPHIPLIGGPSPINVKPGNQVAAETQCGPGGSRMIYRSGSQHS